MAAGSDEDKIILLSKLAVAEHAEDDFVAAVEILLKLIDNILQHPTEQKFRRIRPQNATISGKVLSVKGMKEVIEHLGWAEAEGGEALVLPDNAVAGLRTARGTLAERHYWMTQREAREALEHRKAEFAERQKELDRIHHQMDDDMRMRHSRPKAQASVATERHEGGYKKFEPKGGG
eukprot:Hpha_TRINITY_DN2039_c0_g1::TRINITY_DN2039_c0_g1_i1::g.82888::m.82888